MSHRVRNEEQQRKALIDLEAPEGVSLVDMGAVTEILDAMFKMSIDLDHDPLGGGPTRIQRKIAEVRNMHTAVVQWHQTVSRADHNLSQALRLLRTEFEAQQADLLAHDPEVKEMPNQKSQMAMTQVKMRDLIQKVSRFEMAVGDTTHLLKAINLKRSDLKDLIARLRDQTRICQDEIQLGRVWGSKIPDSRFRLNPEMDRAVSDDVSSLLQEVVLGAEDSVTSSSQKRPSSLRMTKDDPIDDTSVMGTSSRIQEREPVSMIERQVERQEFSIAYRDEDDILQGQQVTVASADVALDLLDLSALLAEGQVEEGFDPDAVGDNLPDGFWESLK